jgi:hypothetical protein
MFWRKKQVPWYLKTLIILIVLRIMYMVAKLFMKAVDKNTGSRDSKAA